MPGLPSIAPTPFGYLLGHTVYSAGSNTQTDYTSTTRSDIDGTNLKVTVLVPFKQDIVIEIEFVSNAATCYFGIRENGSLVTNEHLQSMGDLSWTRQRFTFKIANVAPGIHTYVPSIRVISGTTSILSSQSWGTKCIFVWGRGPNRILRPGQFPPGTILGQMVSQPSTDQFFNHATINTYENWSSLTHADIVLPVKQDIIIRMECNGAPTSGMNVDYFAVRDGISGPVNNQLCYFYQVNTIYRERATIKIPDVVGKHQYYAVIRTTDGSGLTMYYGPTYGPLSIVAIAA